MPRYSFEGRSSMASGRSHRYCTCAKLPQLASPEGEPASKFRVWWGRGEQQQHFHDQRPLLMPNKQRAGPHQSARSIPGAIPNHPFHTSCAAARPCPPLWPGGWTVCHRGILAGWGCHRVWPPVPKISANRTWLGSGLNRPRMGCKTFFGRR